MPTSPKPGGKGKKRKEKKAAEMGSPEQDERTVEPDVTSEPAPESSTPVPEEAQAFFPEDPRPVDATPVQQETPANEAAEPVSEMLQQGVTQEDAVPVPVETQPEVQEAPATEVDLSVHEVPQEEMTHENPAPEAQPEVPVESEPEPEAEPQPAEPEDTAETHVQLDEVATPEDFATPRPVMSLDDLSPEEANEERPAVEAMMPLISLTEEHTETVPEMFVTAPETEPETVSSLTVVACNLAEICSSSLLPHPPRAVHTDQLSPVTMDMSPEPETTIQPLMPPEEATEAAVTAPMAELVQSLADLAEVPETHVALDEPGVVSIVHEPEPVVEAPMAVDEVDVYTYGSQPMVGEQEDQQQPEMTMHEVLQEETMPADETHAHEGMEEHDAPLDDSLRHSNHAGAAVSHSFAAEVVEEVAEVAMAFINQDAVVEKGRSASTTHAPGPEVVTASEPLVQDSAAPYMTVQRRRSSIRGPPENTTSTMAEQPPMAGMSIEPESVMAAEEEPVEREESRVVEDADIELEVEDGDDHTAPVICNAPLVDVELAPVTAPTAKTPAPITAPVVAKDNTSTSKALDRMQAPPGAGTVALQPAPQPPAAKSCCVVS